MKTIDRETIITLDRDKYYLVHSVGCITGNTIIRYYKPYAKNYWVSHSTTGGFSPATVSDSSLHGYLTNGNEISNIYEIKPEELESALMLVELVL